MVYIDIYSASWCQPCRTLIPKIQEEAAKIEHVEVRVHKEPGLWPAPPDGGAAITSVPTTFVGRTRFSPGSSPVAIFREVRRQLDAL
jgi:thiol-disulfide isomerase/thioredoxin